MLLGGVAIIRCGSSAGQDALLQRYLLMSEGRSESKGIV